MIKKIVSLTFVAVFSLAMAFAQQDSLQINKEAKKSLYRGYTGGMMVHLGYGYGGTLTPTGSAQSFDVQGIQSGIGGRLVIALGDHFRVGSEGYVSTLNYGNHRSAEIGWGGLTADYGWLLGKVRPHVGLSVGGGSYGNKCTINEPTNDNQAGEVVWHEYSVFLLTPYVGIEYQFTKKLALLVRADWITSPTANRNEFRDFSSGPRIHVGVMFSH